MEICFLLWICLLNVVTSYHFEHFEERRPSKYEQSHDRRRNFNFNPFRKRTHGTYYDQRRQRPRFPRQQSPDSYGAPSEPPVTNAPQTCPAECSCSCPSTPPPSPAPTRPPPSSYYSSSPPPPSSTTTQAPPPQPSYSNYVTQASNSHSGGPSIYTQSNEAPAPAQSNTYSGSYQGQSSSTSSDSGSSWSVWSQSIPEVFGPSDPSYESNNLPDEESSFQVTGVSYDDSTYDFDNSGGGGGDNTPASPSSPSSRPIQYQVSGSSQNSNNQNSEGSNVVGPNQTSGSNGARPSQTQGSNQKPRRINAKVLVPCSRSAVFNFEFAFENCF